MYLSESRILMRPGRCEHGVVHDDYSKRLIAGEVLQVSTLQQENASGFTPSCGDDTGNKGDLRWP